MGTILRTEDLCRSFGGVLATNYVNLEIEDKGLRSIIGPNGAGKTTLINVITGRLSASAGKVNYLGKDITNKPPHELVRLGICRTFQITSIFMGSSVFENVRIARQARRGGSLRILSSRSSLSRVNEDAGSLIERLGLTEVFREPAKNLAYGDQRLLEVAIALAGDPKVLFLDEPTAGMSPAETERTAGLIRDLSDELSVVLVEHDMDLVMSISDSITVLHNGMIIAEGPPEIIRENEQVREAYLGKDE
ncbi:MAG: ABC transporter ATP-binding protein [Deltaproteobacteria bacterium]|nr:ABC transporter ATP-binding protein [Deltaproteobacteria bacterium]